MDDPAALASLFGYRRKVYTCVACEKDACTEQELFCPTCWTVRTAPPTIPTLPTLEDLWK